VVLVSVAAHETWRMLHEFPYVSMENRLPLAITRRPEAYLPPAAIHRLDSLETLLDNQNGVSGLRAAVLRQIHEETVQVFVQQPTFGGVARMHSIFPYLKGRGFREEPPISQPGSSSPSPWLLEVLETAPDVSKDADMLQSFHQESVVDFANPIAFGFLKDRRHVAGFQEHQISKTPTPSDRWELQTLDLIGVVQHAYVSEHLPRMDELRAAPTRSLDEFEAAGLPALERGEDLFVRDREQERRMLGAIRAARQCLDCHGGERGDLLGAFSYTLIQDRK
jgi:hypothetical protein